MEFNQILELIDHVSASELTAFTYETDDLTLTMEHGKPQIIQGVMGNCGEHPGSRNDRWKSPQGSSEDGRPGEYRSAEQPVSICCAGK